MHSLSRGFRVALVLSLSLGYVAARHGHAYAQDDDDESGEDDAGGDDGGDSSADDGGDGDGGEDEAEDDKDQPPVTAGGLFTMRTYPVRELSRPLTMTQGIGQLRLTLGTDLSAKGAFESFGVGLEGIYGIRDNVSIIGGLTDAYNFKQFGFYFGVETALIYDLVDFRIAANVHRNAIPGYSQFCNPPAMPNEVANPGCQNASAAIETLPNGDFTGGGTKFSIDIGFPFRYSFTPQIAVVALQTLMSIDFNSVSQDFVTVSPIEGAAPGTPTVTTEVKGNGAKPDLNPSLGIATNPIAALSVVLFAQLRIPDFDTSAGAFQIPLTGRIEFSPSQKLDVGLEFTLLNVKPPEGQSPIDNRFLSLFAQARFGK